MTRDESAHLKLRLLADGVSYDGAFLESYRMDRDAIEKRRAYGNSDLLVLDQKVPQEVLLPSGVVVAVNHNPASRWVLNRRNHAYEICNDGVVCPVSVPRRPAFYGPSLSSGIRAERVVTLYGGGTVGVFSPAVCHYFQDDRQCAFCSLKSTRSLYADHEQLISPELAREAVQLAVDTEGERLHHILLNGGTLRDYDKGFERHVAVMEALSETRRPSHIQLHLISMPPRNTALFERLAATGANIVMCLEIFDPRLFAQICPGKSQGYGREAMFDAFDAAVAVLGRGNAYCGFVAGLEPVSSLIEGVTAMAERGVAPAVNVFHPDKGTPLQRQPRPKVEDLARVGRHMGNIFAENGWRPFIRDSGRNSLDTEAHNQCFGPGTVVH